MILLRRTTVKTKLYFTFYTFTFSDVLSTFFHHPRNLRSLCVCRVIKYMDSRLIDIWIMNSRAVRSSQNDFLYEKRQNENIANVQKGREFSSQFFHVFRQHCERFSLIFPLSSHRWRSMIFNPPYESLSENEISHSFSQWRLLMMEIPLQHRKKVTKFFSISREMKFPKFILSVFRDTLTWSDEFSQDSNKFIFCDFDLQTVN